MKWIAGNERLPGMFKEVKWRNHDGGDIPLGKRSPIDHYQKVGPNAGWHQWLDESESLPTPCSKTMEEALKDSMFMNGGNTDEEKKFYAMGFKAALSSSTNGWVKFDASDNKTFPRLGDCYNVVWDMEDGGLPTTTTMEWDAINNRWRDVIGTPEADQIVLYWQPLPPPPNH